MKIEDAQRRLEGCLRELYRQGYCERRDLILWLDATTGEVVAVGSAIETEWLPFMAAEYVEYTQYGVYFVNPGTCLDLRRLRFGSPPPRHLGPPAFEGEEATQLLELGVDFGEFFLEAGRYRVVRQGTRTDDEDFSNGPSTDDDDEPWGEYSDYEALPRRAPSRRRVA